MPASERLEYPKRRNIPARDIDIPARSSSGGSPSVPPKINVNTGGKGGTVVLITGVLFVGYLYFTRRLPNVFKAIQMPPNQYNLSTITQAGKTNPPVAPYMPVEVAPLGRKVEVIVRYPPNYKLPDEKITVLSTTCRETVYSLVLARTGSPSVASMIANNTLCG